jgi:hypothetical protein
LERLPPPAPVSVSDGAEPVVDGVSVMDGVWLLGALSPGSLEHAVATSASASASAATIGRAIARRCSWLANGLSAVHDEGAPDGEPPVSEQSHSTAEAISSGRPIRPMGS